MCLKTHQLNNKNYTANLLEARFESFKMKIKRSRSQLQLRKNLLILQHNLASKKRRFLFAYKGVTFFNSLISKLTYPLQSKYPLTSTVMQLYIDYQITIDTQSFISNVRQKLFEKVTKKLQSSAKSQKETQKKKKDKQHVSENPVESQPKDVPNDQKQFLQNNGTQKYINSQYKQK
ncbi:Hypothetical_protein [Hexamita inflata]|uniref:Hypothetical_protein n=1 Tax=Hexamita inflata TaxID=28002 RepID=A0AA86U6N6_9EUKA|nr:Hypothetical protein HINF_LOCUS28966 [Hexamita inflata]